MHQTYAPREIAEFHVHVSMGNRDECYVCWLLGLVGKLNNDLEVAKRQFMALDEAKAPYRLMLAAQLLTQDRAYSRDGGNVKAAWIFEQVDALINYEAANPRRIS